MTHARTTALHDSHAALGAIFTEFGGWEMPVRYGSELAEHRAVREAAGLFDISHMAEFLVEGGRAADFLDYALSGPISAVPIGRAKYSLLLAEDGGILDDVIVYRTGTAHFLVIANAGNREIVADALARRREVWPHVQAFLDGRPADGAFGAVAGADVPRVEDVTDRVALLAIQGPRAADVLSRTPGVAITGEPLASLRTYAWTAGAFAGASLFVARTGYTGEDGFELLLPTEHGPALWDALLAAGEGAGLVPAGLAARDTLRLEAGMPLHGHELSPDVHPAQAGLARSVAEDKPDFVGRGTAPGAGAPVLVGLVSEGRRAGRAGYAVADGERVVGRVTSGALSPTLGHPIALAYVEPVAAAPGTVLSIDVRGTAVPATVTVPPFYRRTA
jgi:aminomethyltransferase